MIVESGGDDGWSCDCTPLANSRLAHGLTSAYCCAATWPSVVHARVHAPSNTSYCACLAPVVTFNFLLNYINLTLIRPLEEPDIAGCPCTLGLGVC